MPNTTSSVLHFTLSEFLEDEVTLLLTGRGWRRSPCVFAFGCRVVRFLSELVSGQNAQNFCRSKHNLREFETKFLMNESRNYIVGKYRDACQGTYCVQLCNAYSNRAVIGGNRLFNYQFQTPLRKMGGHLYKHESLENEYVCPS